MPAPSSLSPSLAGSITSSRYSEPDIAKAVEQGSGRSQLGRDGVGRTAERKPERSSWENIWARSDLVGVVVSCFLEPRAITPSTVLSEPHSAAEILMKVIN